MPESPQQRLEATGAYIIELSDSRLAVAMFGVVEFLRRHLILRVAVATVGIVVVLASFASLAGLRIAWFNGFGIFTLLFVGPFILWVATVSGTHFALVIQPGAPSPQRAVEERLEAEKQFEKSNALEDALKLDLTRLQEYYTLNQSQARSSFRWAKLSMLAGFVTIYRRDLALLFPPD